VLMFDSFVVNVRNSKGNCMLMDFKLSSSFPLNSSFGFSRIEQPPIELHGMPPFHWLEQASLIFIQEGIIYLPCCGCFQHLQLTCKHAGSDGRSFSVRIIFSKVTKKTRNY
jgi:hypothetical protein